MAKLKK